MKMGSKYKIARRLGAAVFEKTQTAKFALRTERRNQKAGRRRMGARSNYGKQLIEKQKVRYTYGLSEKQFAKYIKKVIDKNPANPSELLYTFLERRLDNVVLRTGFAATRLAARQLVSHGHMLVNGRRMTIPSYEVQEGDVISIREGSKDKGLFIELAERLTETTAPAWLSVNKTKNDITIKGIPTYSPSDVHFDLEQVLQFYKR